MQGERFPLRKNRPPIYSPGGSIRHSPLPARFAEPKIRFGSPGLTGSRTSDTDILTDFTHNIHTFPEDQGVEFSYETRAEKLVQDESGAVQGVIATKGGESVYYKANAS